MSLLKKILKTIYIRCYQLIRLVFPLKYPKNFDGKVFIHLGCGEVNSPEYINVDNRFFTHIHHISNVERLKFFKDDFADLIYTSHTLEHIHMEEVSATIKEWKRILKPGGILRISVPDFDKIINIYNDNDHSIASIWRPLMGGQEYKENIHLAVFNCNYLEKLLLEIGFTEVYQWNPLNVKNHDFNDWASTLLEVNDKKYQISLNIEAVK